MNPYQHFNFLIEISSRIPKKMTNGLPDKKQRLDTFLAEQKAFRSRMKASQAVRKGLVKVNGRARKGALVLEPGHQGGVSESEEPLTEELLKATDLQLEVLYEDESCLVVNKPAGISVHPARGIPKDAATVLHEASVSLQAAQDSVLPERCARASSG